MNSDKINMYAAAIIGSVLTFLLLHFVSGLVFGTRGHSEHGQLAYALDVEDAGDAGAEVAEVDWSALVASADVAAGEKVFKKCVACHKVEDGANGVGPTLWGVVGRDIASVGGYDFSDALTELEGDWTLQALSGFLENPKAYASGTKMSFGGIKKAADRVNLIVYLNEADGTPIELTTAPAETEVASASTETETEDNSSDGHSDTAAATQTESTASGSTEAATTEVAAAATDSEDSHADMAIAGDAVAGKKVFRKCAACHQLDEGKHRLGPSLAGIIGSDKASAEGYKYSDALVAAGGEWTVSDLDGYLADPRGAIPGNKMTFAGLKKAEDRANVIAYLNDPASAADAAASSSSGTSDSASSATASTSEDTAASSTTEASSSESTASTEGDTQVAAASASADFSSGDAEAGEKVFRKCRACHKADEAKNGVGPTLFGVIGRDKGSIDGFKYSDAMKAAEGDWTASDLNTYLENPKAFIPGNRMSFPGLKKPQDRINVITYLNEADGSPDPLN